MSESIKVLSFESSCDDTSVALLAAKPGRKPEILAMAVQSQDEVHKRYGGIVPELASRAHLSNLLPCLTKVLEESKLKLEDVDLFAATGQPGLVGSLLVGHTAAKTLSFLNQKAFISVNHLEGHIYSIFLEQEPRFPFLSLVVSGGHTSLFRVDSFQSYENIGLTLDDAAGEAFDKAAKLLGLGFPGGAALEKLAREGDPSRYPFPKVQVPSLHFSFSGLKSEFFRLVTKEKERLSAADAAAAYQEAILEHIQTQIQKAILQTGVRRLCIVGGVARNQKLRNLLSDLQRAKVLDEFYAPSPILCTDNAAMIGYVAWQRYSAGGRDNLEADVASTGRPSRERIRREKKA